MGYSRETLGALMSGTGAKFGGLNWSLGLSDEHKVFSFIKGRHAWPVLPEKSKIALLCRVFYLVYC
jgi:hypothetical protein